MKLASDWKDILLRAWSIKFIILAGIFTGLEAAVSFFPSMFPWIGSGYMALMTGFICVAAFVSRIVAQKGLEENGKQD